MDCFFKLVELSISLIVCCLYVKLKTYFDIVTRTNMRMTTSPESDRNNLSGGGNKTLVGNQEAYQTINATIAQIFTTDTSISIQALADLDELMKDNEKVELLENCIDNLYTMCCMQFRHVLQVSHC